MARSNPTLTPPESGRFRLRLRRLAAATRRRLRAVVARVPFVPRPPKSGPPPAPRAPGDDDAYAVARDRIEAFVGRPVGSLALYERALRHRSVLRGKPNGHLQSNERLEFLGDAVLGVAVAERLFAAFPDRNEGFLTRIRAKLVNGVMLAAFAEARGLGDLLLLSPNMAQGEGRSNPTILADAFEAVLGALYLDLGFDAARAFVFELIEEYVDLDTISEQRSNFKSMLLERVQAEGQRQPLYHVVAEEGPSHDRRFTVEVRVGAQPLGLGSARSKKQAEQKAAREALERLREEETEAVAAEKQ